MLLLPEQLREIDDAGLSTAEFRVLGHLCRRADKDGIATPGIRSIAKVCRVSKDTVDRAAKELVKQGYLRIETFRGYKGDQRRYILTLPSVSPEGRLTDQASHEKDTSVSPQGHERLTTRTKEGTIRRNSLLLQNRNLEKLQKSRATPSSEDYRRATAPPSSTRWKPAGGLAGEAKSKTGRRASAPIRPTAGL